MRFGRVPLGEAAGTLLAHAATLPGRRLRKGHVLTPEDLGALAESGVTALVVARPEPGEILEDPAAARAAAGLAGPGLTAAAPFTGRVNLFAGQAGVLLLDPAAVDRLNRIDEAITVATLAPYAMVRPRQMVATVKVIPFAASEAAVAAWESQAVALRVAPFRALRTRLVQTHLPGTKPTMLDKTVEVTRRRIAALGGELVGEARCAHDEAPLAEAVRAACIEGADLVLVAGASAIIDRRDVVPAAVMAAGGVIEHFGMPVDPGNLLLVGRIGQVPVLGLPGCARSPSPNGFDWVLQRLAAGLPAGPDEITRLGVGGLLAETPTRGLPREAAPRPKSAPHVAALVLAAGRSSRMGENKLLIKLAGKSLVARAVDAALGAEASPVIVVTGHQSAAVREELAGRPVRFIENPDHAEGLSTSLKAGLAALPESADAVVICLGDMPGVGPALIRRLGAGFDPAEGREIVVPVHGGRRGNPVLWGRRFLPELAQATGDAGAKHLLGRYPEYLVEVEAGDDGVLADIDTPEALAAYQARPLGIEAAAGYRVGGTAPPHRAENYPQNIMIRSRDGSLPAAR